MRKNKIFKSTLFLLGMMLTLGSAQDQSVTPGMSSDEDKDLKVGDTAPSWALMYAPGKFEFLKNWSEEEGKRLRKLATQPNRHAVLLSFFATWCQPCMKELPLLEDVYQMHNTSAVIRSCDVFGVQQAHAIEVQHKNVLDKEIAILHL